MNEELQAVKLLGVKLFNSDDCDLLDSSCQHNNVKWLLNDMKKYEGMYVDLTFEGNLTIYDLENKIVFEGSLLESEDFKSKLLAQMI